MKRLCSLAVIRWSVAAPGSTFAQDRFFDSKGVSIRYIEQGTGAPVVLLHGIGGSLQTWLDSGVFQNLAGDYRVIALDARGHGKSGKPHDPKQYGPEMALDLVRLLDHLGIKQAHVIGYSMGGGITSQLLTLHPERFLTATLVAASGRFQWSAEDQKMAEQEASEREKETVSRTLIYRLAPINGPKPSDEEIAKRSEACFADSSQDRYAVAALTRSRQDQVITPARAAAVTVPTLGIVGTLDPNMAAVQELKKLRPGLKLIVVDAATHAGDSGILRRSEFITAVREFIGGGRQLSS